MIVVTHSKHIATKAGVISIMCLKDKSLKSTTATTPLFCVEGSNKTNSTATSIALKRSFLGIFAGSHSTKKLFREISVMTL